MDLVFFRKNLYSKKLYGIRIWRNSMKFHHTKIGIGTLILFFILQHVKLFAEEGMWSFDNLPVDQLLIKYGFEPTEEWLDPIRLSSVRFNNGGSGSFISPDGLVLTNHHVAMSVLQGISDSEKDYVKDGFYADKKAEEIRCPGLELNVLVEMSDITDRVAAAVTDSMNDVEAMEAKRGICASIEQEAKNKTGLRSDVVSLYHGGEFWLYQYKKYTDIRLVMVPERQAAYFGGDNDNFTYPRYDLDMAFFRVYENGQSLKNEHHLKWNSRGVEEDELVFISGHPGRTNRLYTVDQLLYIKDVHLPMVLEYIQARMDILKDYASQGKEESRRALETIFYLENSKKAYTGMINGLRAPGVFEEKIRKETDMKERISEDSLLSVLYADAWDTLSVVAKLKAEFAKSWYYRKVIGSRMAEWAVKAVFYHQEIQKPDRDRLKGYHEAELEEMKFYYLSPAPVYKDFEMFQFAGGLKLILDQLGSEDPFVKAALSGKSAEETARTLIKESRMHQVEFRKTCLESDAETFESIEDPLIQWARHIVPVLRKDIEFKEHHVDGKRNRAQEKIAKARFAVYGKTIYPDANFTLRLTYGRVKGYPMNGTKAPVHTTLYGLYDRSLSFNQQGDYALPERFWKEQKKLDLSTPVNFVCTCDIIGGNSGSPVINAQGEIVGLVFDGNIESLPGRYYFDETLNRAVSVHTAYITEALKKLYRGKKLLKEIGVNQ